MSTLRDLLGRLTRRAKATDDLALRIDQLEALHALRFVPIVSNVCGPLLVWATLGGSDNLIATGWLLLALGLVVTDLATGVSIRGGRPAQHEVARDQRRAVLMCVGYGIMWGLLASLFHSSATADERHFIIVVLTGYLASAPLVLSAMPTAVLAFTIPLLAQVVPVLVLDGVQQNAVLLQMIGAYMLMLVFTLRHYWRSFAERTRALVEVDEQKQLIGVLLDDVTTSTSEWLWQTDAALRFAKVSEPFRNEVRRHADLLLGLDIDTALERYFTIDGQPDAGAVEACRAMKAMEPFRDVLVKICADGVERWWSISGTPSHDRDGVFNGYRGIGRDITEKRRAECELTHLAHHDALTGAANRASFNREIERIGAAVRGGGRRFALIQFDLDDFKAVNDTAGHAAGDQVLREAYRRMKSTLPPDAFMARMGGDEFVVVLEIGLEQKKEEVRQLAEAMVNAVSRPIESAAGMFRIGTSAGIALLPDHGYDVQAVVQLADIALYNAKADDVSRVHLASAEDGAAYSYRKILERDLRSAVDCGELELYFQPVVDARTGRTMVLEALLRWRHPRFGLVSPAEFIPIAEQTGSIQRIGSWALREACRLAAGWPDAIRVAVNISPRQLDRDDLGSKVLEALKVSGLSPDRLELEITESAFLSGVDRVRMTVLRLQGYGVTVAMDDFGTGYSSLSSLQNVPFDKLKIDRSLVARDRSEKRAVSILKSILAIGSALELHVTAEGVETAEQAAFLKGLGCNSLQGYLFARPMPAQEVPVFFAREAQRMLQGARRADEAAAPVSQAL